MYILQIEGMTCESCKRAISNAISNAAPGVAFEVDLRRNQVRFRAVSAEQQADIRNAVRAAGFGIVETARS